MNSDKHSDRDSLRSPSARRRERGPVSFRRAPARDAEERTSLSEFSQVVAHRIGGLVSTIEGFTELLIDGIDRKDDRETAFGILESVSRIEAILHDLKHYDDEIDIRPRELSVERLVTGVFNVLADSEAERVSITSDAPNDLMFEVDERLIRQALLSVIRNGLEATAAGSGSLHLRIESDAAAESVAIRISNSGRLAAGSDADRIFDAFYTTKAHNLGLGLTMARRFARLNGGDLVYASDADDEMTEFVLTLPVSPAAESRNAKS
jgi:signal transduction histidine kinase